MEQTAHLAGFIAAHAIWSVSDGAILIPMLGSVSADAKQMLERLVMDDAQQAVDHGRKQLAENARQAVHAAFAFDGYITLADGKTDAIFVEARGYGSGDPLEFNIAIPYRNAANGFAVYRPKVLALPKGDQKTLLEAFWAGVDSHEEAAAVWSAHLDQSR
jgi:hypothetical protein